MIAQFVYGGQRRPVLSARMSGAATATATGSTRMAMHMATVSFTSATGTAPNDLPGQFIQASVNPPFLYFPPGRRIATAIVKKQKQKNKAAAQSVGKPAGFRAPSFPCSNMTVVTFIS